ncbi:MAG TPA: hypothetical protein VFL10_16945 [Ornithinibacter sp.]|nr:hypothetical protein [Ornithinibacter sp.]
MTSKRWPVRATGGLGVAWGGLLLGRGDRVWRAVTGEAPTPVDLRAVEALGLRHLAQGTVQVVAPTRMRGAFVAIDLIHVLTMLPVAVADERRRRAAALTCAIALMSAATTLGAGRRPRTDER